MYVVSVTIFVKPEFTARFIEATFDNAANSRLEPGNLRFDVHQAEDDPNRVLLHEVYREKEDFVRHQQTAHYARWRDTVADWFAQPRQSAKYIPLFYGEAKV
jgi:autoinducer 2-degrading protein